MTAGATREVDVLVIGAGVAGLGAALELERRGREVCLVDAGDAPGGVMRTDAIRGYRVERGPNTFQLKPVLRAALRAHGLEARLLRAAPASRKRFLLRGRALVPVPMGPLALLRTPLLSAHGRLRLLCEPFVRKGSGEHETVSEFASRRLGAEACRALVGPFLTGVYAGDERQLGAQAVFPGLVDLEREHGSLVVGSLLRALRRGEERATPGTFSHAEGLGALSALLASALAGPVHLHTRVRGLARDGAGVRVVVEPSRDGDGDDGDGGDGGGDGYERGRSGATSAARAAAGAGLSGQIRARAVVVAVAADAAARIVSGLDGDAARALDAFAYAPIASVAVGAGQNALAQPASGFGFLVPREEKRSLLGCLFMSELFPRRAPPGKQLLHCMVGGTRSPELLDLDDASLGRRVHEELDRILGVREELETVSVRRWSRAVAQPGVDHRANVRAVRERLALAGPIALAGGYTDGVSVGDSFASGVSAAAALVAG